MTRYLNEIKTHKQARFLSYLVLLWLSVWVYPTLAATPAKLYTAGVDVMSGGTTLGSPAGGFFDGRFFWISDRSADLSRLTPVSTGFPKTAIDYLNSFPTLTLSQSNLIVGGGVGNLAGQPVFDRLTGVGYAPMGRSGRGGPGIVRFRVSSNVIVQSNAIATTSGLSGKRPKAVAMGPDGNLYVGLGSSGTIYKIVIPQIGTTQLVVPIGSTLKGKSVNGLAFLGDDLYIAQQDGFSKIANASNCILICVAEAVPGSVARKNYWAVTADRASNTLFVAYDGQVNSYDPLTKRETLVVNSGQYPDGSLQTLKFSGNGAGLTVSTDNAIRTLWVCDNVATGLPYEGRLWTVTLP